MEQGSAREGVRPAYAPGAFSRAPADGRMPEARVPEQARGEQAGAEWAGGRPADGEQARGEHTHSEPPAPRVVQRHSVRGQI
ncbi:GntR family transcriptional regulator, partial [Streptomyces anulatus]